MIRKKGALFWDSCVLIRYLNEGVHGHPDYLQHIDRFLSETAEYELICSLILIGEVTHSSIGPRYPSIEEFRREFYARFQVIAPNIEIAENVARLRSRSYQTKTPQASQKYRIFSTPDAFHLMTALYAVEVLGYTDLVFHTFDNGRSRTGGEPKTVPLLSLRDWTENCADDPLIARLRELRIEPPCHPALSRPGET